MRRVARSTFARVLARVRAELIYMTPPNQDATQQPEFRVTKATMALVPLDFDRYKPSLERMAAHWREEKEGEMKKANAALRAA